MRGLLVVLFEGGGRFGVPDGCRLSAKFFNYFINNFFFSPVNFDLNKLYRITGLKTRFPEILSLN